MKKVFFIFIGIAILAGAFLGWDVLKCQDDWCFMFEWQKIRAADSFEHCVSLGFPVIEVYPPECRAGGKSFPEGADRNDNSVHDIPPPKVVAAVRSVVAERFKINKDDAVIISAYKKEWPSSCLGLSPTDFGCAEVITPGYEVTVLALDRQFVYRTNADGSVVKAK